MTARPLGEPRATHLRGFAFLAAGQTLARGMTFLAVAYLARTLGVEMFGVVGFGAVVASYLLLIVDAGLDLVAMREIARSGSLVESVVSSIFATRLVLAGLAAASLWGIAPWLASSPAALAVILAYSLTFLSFASNLKWGFQAREQNGVVAAALVVSQAAYLAGVLLWVRGPGDAPRVPLLLFAAELAGATLLLVRYRRQGFRLWVPRSVRLSWTLLREAMPLAATRLVRTLTVNFDLLVLGMVAAPAAVGIYVAVSRISLFLRELGELYYFALFPQLSRAASGPAAGFAAVGRVGLRHAMIIILPVAVGGCLTGPALLSFLFGPGYGAGAPVLCLMLAGMVFAILAGGYRLGLVAHHRQGALFRIMATGAAFNVALNLVLIPKYSIVGGALSGLLSEALTFVLVWVAMARSSPLSPWRPLLRPVLAAAGLAIILSVLPAWPILLTVAVGGVSYAVLVFLVGAVHLQEIAEIVREQAASPVRDSKTERPGGRGSRAARLGP